jgi:thioesterase domain-containing protein
MTRLPDRPVPRRPLLRQLREPAGPVRLWVYAVHPGGLTADVWQGLADILPADVGLSVFDLQNVPEYFEAALTGGVPAISLEEIGRRGRAELTAQHPAGVPFALVGWSFGGVVAFEMSRALDPVGLVLLDSIAPTQDFKRTDDLLHPPLLLRWFAMYLAAKRGRPLTEEPNIGAETAEAGLATLLATVTANGVLPADTAPAGLRKLYDSYVGGLKRNNHLVLPYEPGAAERSLTLVKPARSLLPEYDDLGWSELAPTRLVSAPGDHYSMLYDPSAWAVVAALVSRPQASAAA